MVVVNHRGHIVTFDQREVLLWTELVDSLRGFVNRSASV